MPNWDALLRVAREHGISVVEDAAEAFGSQYGGKMAGSFGETGCFSFHGSKTVTTGEGGMLVTDDSDLFDRILFLRDHGRVPGDVSFVNAEVAFKYKMSAMQAAMGLAQVERAQELVKKKRTVFGWYRDRLEGVDGIFLNTEPEGVLNSYWMSTVILDPGFGLDKFDVIRELKARGIATRPFFSPLSSLPAFAASEQAKRASGRNIIGYRISRYGINLPSGLQLQETDVRRVCNALKEILGGTPWK
jgi:perosamine synthetase